MVTDEELIPEFLRGSNQAFEELFRRFLRPIYAFFRRRLNNVARADELAQETFLAVLRGGEPYEPRAPVRTYLFGIAFRQPNAEWSCLSNDTRAIGLSPRKPQTPRN